MHLKDLEKEQVLRDGEFEVLGIIDSLTSLPMLTFLDNEKYIDRLLEKKTITCVYTTREIGKQLLEKSDLGIMISEDPRIEFFKLHNELGKTSCYCRKSFKTKIGTGCSISPLACISPMNVIIGDHVIIEEFASIKENTVIGNDCIIRTGAVIGGTGFEFKHCDGETFGVNHYGGTVLEQGVEIQYNCTIDRALYPWDDTKIGAYTKFDNLVHVGHAAKIGKNVLFPAGTTVSGRVEIEDNVWIGVGSVISNGIHFGEDSRCNIGSVVTKNVGKDESVTGNFAIDHKKFLENLKRIR